MKKAYNVINDNTSLENNNLENCLFIINIFDNLDENEKNKIQIQNDFSNIIFADLENREEKSKYIKTELFNPKAYFEFIVELTHIVNFKNLLFKLKMDYLNKKRKKKTFIEFCLSYIESKFKESYININIKEINKCDESFNKNIKKEILHIIEDLKLQYNEEIDEDNLRAFSNILQYMIINFIKNKFYINSNCEKFFNILETQIDKANRNTQKNYQNNLKECFKFYDLIFEKDINSDNSIKIEDYKEKCEALKKKLNNIEKKYEMEKIFDKYLEKIDSLFTFLDENQEYLIKKYEKDIKELVKEELENKISFKATILFKVSSLFWFTNSTMLS